MVKSLEFFLKATASVKQVNFFLVLVKSYSILPVHLQCIEKAFFLCFLRSPLEKILDPKICINPVLCCNLLATSLHYFFY